MTNEPAEPSATLLQQSAKAERKLIQREESAEKAVKQAAERLAKAEEKLAMAQERVFRRRAELTKVENVLRERQSERALGPSNDGTSTPLNGEVPSEQAATSLEPTKSNSLRNDGEREPSESIVD
jgi:hypothetical protein